MCKVDNNNDFAVWGTAGKALGPGTYVNVMFTYSIHQNIGTAQALSNVLVHRTHDPKDTILKIIFLMLHS